MGLFIGCLYFILITTFTVSWRTKPWFLEVCFLSWAHNFWAHGYLIDTNYTDSMDSDNFVFLIFFLGGFQRFKIAVFSQIHITQYKNKFASYDCLADYLSFKMLNKFLAWVKFIRRLNNKVECKLIFILMPLSSRDCL